MRILPGIQSLRTIDLKLPVYLAVGLLLLGWLLNTPAGLLGKADAVGYAVCHRIEARSFHLGDRALPLCARCTGMYLGAMLGLAYQALLRPRHTGSPPWKVLLPLGLLAAAFVIDGLNSYLHFFSNAPVLYEPSNAGRLLTGTGMGLVIAAALYPAFNGTVWRDSSSRPALDSLPALGGLLLLALILDALVWTENPLILYPLALVSAGGVLVLLSMVYAIIWLMVVRAENRFLHKRELLLPLTAGLGVAILQIAAIGFVRFWLTGTWSGFVLG
jgi:uncharacterized membrane protein